MNRFARTLYSWGQWHRADHDGIGMDRTVASGTGFVGQSSPQVVRTYESLGLSHHVPYTYLLHSGKTAIQHIYTNRAIA